MNRVLGLWLLALTAPVVWFIDLEADFAVAGWTCAWRSRLALALISAASLAVVAGTGLVARRRQSYSSGAAQSSLALLTGGLVLSLLFFIVILAQIVPTIFLDGCQ